MDREPLNYRATSCASQKSTKKTDEYVVQQVRFKQKYSGLKELKEHEEAKFWFNTKNRVSHTMVRIGKMRE